MATIWQKSVRCSCCERKFDVKTNSMTPLPDTWQCGRADCARSPRRQAKVDQFLGQTSTKPAKYRNEPRTVDGHRFASKREADRYGELLLMVRASEITRPELQQAFRLEVNGQLVCKYVADFVYRRLSDDAVIVEDAKGVKTREYVIKKKLMLAVHGIEIVEV